MRRDREEERENTNHKTGFKRRNKASGCTKIKI